MVSSSIMELEKRENNGLHDAAGPEHRHPEEDAQPTGGACDDRSAAAGAPASPEQPGPLRGLLAELRRGGRVSVGLPADPGHPRSTPATLALLVVADLLLNFCTSFLLVGRGGYFSYAAVPSFFFHLPLFLCLGLFAERDLRRPCLIPGIASTLVALSFPVELCHAALEGLAQLRRFERLEDYLAAPHYYRFFWWWAAAALLFLARLKGGDARRRFRVALLFVLLVLPLLWYFPRGDLWVSAPPESESGELRLTEEVLAAQQKLMDQALAALEPGRAGLPDLYFVGFAGDASQDVFLKELSFARRLFDERFGSAGRSVLLANNPQSALRFPFASNANLERVLTRVGHLMNRDEDLLFLYISSHGSKDHELEVSNAPLELKTLTPERLRKILRKSGIKWKVVVVSACFSGGFVEPLQEPGTLIITASDATRESFGCGFGEEFTWFGQAFLGDALGQTFSFTKAFEAARETIRQWEEERGETPSNPQIWGGKEIWPRLEGVEKELERRPQ